MFNKKIPGDKATQIAEEFCEKLIPHIEKEYKISLEPPTFSRGQGGYMKSWATMTHNRGVIKVRDDIDWSEKDLLLDVGEQLGYAALYQNSPIGELYEKNGFEATDLKVIEKGVGENFRNSTYRYLLDSPTRSEIDSITYRLKIASEKVGRVMDSKIRKRGRKLLGKEEPERITEVIKNPEKFYKENFGEEYGIINFESDRTETVTSH